MIDPEIRNSLQRNKTFWRRYCVEWLAVFAFLAGLAWILEGSQPVKLADNYVYDRLISARERVPHSNIVIVSVDEYSLKEIGRWPWPRIVHQKLFEQLATAEPKAVLFDFLLTEPSNPASIDQQLGLAIGRTHTVLPMLLASYGGNMPEAILPVPQLAENAQLGHILVHPDSDGILRSVDLGLKDEQGKTWPLATKLLLDEQAQIQSNASFRIPFSVAKGAYPTVPYVSLIKGEVSPDFLRGKYVLVGATAVGLGDQYTTPLSGSAGLVSGIEVHANILDSLLNHEQISVVNEPHWELINWLVPLTLLMMVFFAFKEHYHVIAMIMLFVIYVGSVLFLLIQHHLWLPPVLTLFILLLAYLMWSWRRMVIVLGYVQTSINLIKSDRSTLTQFLLPQRKQQWFVPQVIEQGVQQIQRFYQFTYDSLNHMPTALLVVSETGQIVFSNQYALQSFGYEHVNLQGLLQQIDHKVDVSKIKNGLNYLQDVELQGQNDQLFVLHVTEISFDDLKPFSNRSKRSKSDAVWLIHFLDLTQERLAQRQRSELMQFLSHDLRSPQVSILSLLALQKNDKTRLSEDELHTKITARVQHTLDWAHDLARLSHAKAGNYQWDEVSLLNIIEDALDSLRPQALEKDISFTFESESIETAAQSWIMADGELLIRAFVNILSNSIRYSYQGGTIELIVNTEVELYNRTVVCRIKDHGQGMDAQKVERLLNQNISIKGISEKNHPDAARSLGIGFFMARTVIERHGGQITIQSELGLGTTTDLSLPLQG